MKSKLAKRILITVTVTVVTIVAEHLLDQLNEPQADEEKRNSIGFL